MSLASYPAPIWQQNLRFVSKWKRKWAWIGEFATEDKKQTLIQTSLFCLIPTSVDLKARECLWLWGQGQSPCCRWGERRHGDLPCFPSHHLESAEPIHDTSLYLLLGLILERIQIACILYFWNFVWNVWKHFRVWMSQRISLCDSLSCKE